MLDQSIVNQALSQLGCVVSDAKLLGGYNGNVFGVRRRGSDIVVKILEAAVTPAEQLVSELEWLEFLHESGMAVNRPLRLEDGQYIQPVSDDYYFVVFDKVEGQHISPGNSDLWNAALFDCWGKAMGELHTFAQSYQAVHARPQWFQNELLREERVLSDLLLAEKWKQYHEEIKQLPASKEEYGLIHGDLHHHNFLLHEDQLTVLDFGDCEYHWFAYDIAVVIYHTAQTVAEGAEREKFIRAFFSSFMDGYARGNSSMAWMSRVDFFINYRQLFSYTYHSHYADFSRMGKEQRMALARMRESLLDRDSFLGFKLV